MTAALFCAGLAAALGLGGLIAFETRRHVRAARAQRAAGLDEDDRTPVATRVRLGLAEIASLCTGLARLVVPSATPIARQADRPVLIVTASLPAHGCARALAARLRRDGWGDVSAVRLGVRWPGYGAATARLARVLARESGSQILLVAHGRAGLAARAVASETRSVRRLLTLGTPHGERPAPDARDRVEAIAIASPDDPTLLPPGVSYWPPACNISVRAVGPLGMLTSPLVQDLVAENLGAPLGPAARLVEPERGA